MSRLGEPRPAKPAAEIEWFQTVCGTARTTKRRCGTLIRALVGQTCWDQKLREGGTIDRYKYMVDAGEIDSSYHIHSEFVSA
jgi:hypothetical protein